MTANTMAWNSGSNSASNGQLMKTFVAYPAGVLARGIGLEGLPAQGRIDRVLDLLQRQPAAPRDCWNLGCLGRLANLLPHWFRRRLNRAARDFAGHRMVTPGIEI